MTFKSSFLLFTSAVLLSLTGCSSSPKTFDVSTNKLTSVTAQLYIGDLGKRLDSVEYHFTQPLSASTLSALKLTLVATFHNSQSPNTPNKREKLSINRVGWVGKKLVIDIGDINTTGLLGIEVDSNLPQLTTSHLVYTSHIRSVDDFVHHRFIAKDGTKLSYWLYLPDHQPLAPLMVWEHGGGEVLSSSYPRANLEANRGATAWVESSHPTAVLSVQYPDNYRFGIADIPDQFEQMQRYNTAKYELIQSLIDSKLIDAKRVYLSGASSGGGAGLRFIMQYPKLFAAAVIIAAKDTIVPLSDKYHLAYQFDAPISALRLAEDDYESSYQEMENALSDSNITNVPIWFAQAKNDRICTSYTSIMMFDILQKQGATANHLTLYSDADMAAAQVPLNHFSWVPTLNNRKIIDWVYQQHK